MRLTNLYVLLVALNIGGFPLVAGGTQYLGLGSTSYSIAMRSIVLGSSLLLILFAFSSNKVRVSRGAFWLPLIIFWISYLLRIYINTTDDPGNLSRSPSEYWVWSVGACLIPMLGLLTYPGSSRNYLATSYRLSLLVLTFAAVLVALTGSGSYSKAGMTYELGRLNIASLNPISVGHLGASLLLLSMWPLVHQASQVYWKALYGLLGLLGLYLLLAAASRGPLLALIIVILFYVAAQDLKRFAKILPIFVLLLWAASELGTYLESSENYKVFGRAESALSGEDQSVAGRQISYRGAAQQFLEHPVFGDALEEKQTMYYPHNVILESYMATGLVGGVSFTVLIAYGILAAFKIAKAKAQHGWIALIFIQYLVGAQFSGALYTSTTMWTFLATTIVAFNVRKHRSPNLKQSYN